MIIEKGNFLKRVTSRVGIMRKKNLKVLGEDGKAKWEDIMPENGKEMIGIK